jgi:hypothetical protein
MRVFISILSIILIVGLVGCSAISSGNINYIKEYVASNVDYEIDNFYINEHEKAAQISVISSDAKPENFGLYAEQVLKAILSATEDKNVPIYMITISIQQDSSGGTILSWISYDGETGLLMDHRGGIETHSNIRFDEIQFLSDLTGSRASSIAYMENYIKENSFYRIDSLGIVSMSSDIEKLQMSAVTKVMSEDVSIVENFEAHVENIKDLVLEAAAETGLPIYALIITIQDNDDNTIDSKSIFLENED